MTPPPALSRVYWLSFLASKLQGENNYQDTENQNAHISGVGRTLNHLSTCLTRDRRAVAVTSSTYQVNGISVQVFATPPSSPESSPYVSPSSSFKSGLAASAGPSRSVVLARKSKNPDGTYRLTEIEGPEAQALIHKLAEVTGNRSPSKSVVLAKNFKDSTSTYRLADIDPEDPDALNDNLAEVAGNRSPSGSVVLAKNSQDSAGTYQVADIDPENPEAEALIKKIINCPLPMPKSLIPTINFLPFVVLSFGVLRTAAKLLQQAPNAREHLALRNAVCAFFVSSCSRKLKNRVKGFHKLYPIKKLQLWCRHPTDHVFNPFDITVEEPLVQEALKNAGIVPTGVRFSVNTTTLASWWKALLTILMVLERQICSDTPASAPIIVGTSRALHYMIKNLPKELWQHHSLNEMFQDVRLTKNDLQTSEFPATAEEKLEIAEEIASLKNPIENDRPIPDALPFCSTFFRALDMLTAWTTGPTYLLQSRVSTTTANIKLTIVDLPRADIPPTSVEELVGYWNKSQKWTDEQLAKIRNVLKSADPSKSPEAGACHAEAGLIASVLARTKAKPQSGMKQSMSGSSEGTETDLVASVAKPQSGIKQSTVEGSGGGEGTEDNEGDGGGGEKHNEAALELKLAIGVAKKCCPLCRILAEIAQQNYNIQLDLPGQHATFYPWVPPFWLTTRVLLRMEAELLTLVGAFTDSPVPCSRASSPGSDYGQAEDTNDLSERFSNATLEDFLQRQQSALDSPP